MFKLAITHRIYFLLTVLLFNCTAGSLFAKISAEKELELTGGSIQIAGINSDATNFEATIEVLIESVSVAEGAIQGVTYSWEKSKNLNEEWSVIDSTTGLGINDGVIFHTTFYRRKAIDGNGNVAYSNVVSFYKLEILSHPSTSSQVIPLDGAIEALEITHSEVEGTPTYLWYVNSTNSNVGGSPISGATSITYTPDNSIDSWGYYYAVVSDVVSVSSNPSAEVFVGDPIAEVPPNNVIPQYSNQLWYSLLSGDNFDPNDDQNSSTSLDLVGNSTNTMLLTQRNRFNFETEPSPDFVYYFKVRFGDALDSKGLLRASFYLGIDVNGDKIADVFLEANSKNKSTSGVYLHKADLSTPGAGTSPSNTSWLNSSNDETVEIKLDERHSYINTSPVTLDDFSTDTDLDANGQQDSWLEFAVTESAFSNFIASAWSIDVTGDSVLTLFAFTSSLQNPNGDIGGINDQTADLTESWVDLGVTVTSSANELTELKTPTVNGGTFSTTSFVVDGGWGGDQGGSDSLSINLNGQNFIESDSALIINTNQWLLDVSSMGLEAGQSYLISATAIRDTETKTATATIYISEDNADLALLGASGTSLELTNPSILNYQVLVDADQDQTVLTAVSSSSLASITFNGVSYSSGSSLTLNLNYGVNTFQINLVAENQVDSRSYTVQILRGFLPLISEIDPSTDEDGDQGAFYVVLPSQPTADVQINLSVSDNTEAVLDSSILTFTSSNWNVSQTVTLTGIDDPLSEGDAVRDGAQAYNVNGSVSSSDELYNSGQIPTVSMTNQDTDPPGIYLTINNSETTESGGSISISVRLLSTLISDESTVTLPITISDQTEASFSNSELITSTLVVLSNNQLSSTISVYGVDDTIDDGDVLYNLISGDPIADGDSQYDALIASDVADFVLTNLDDDPTSTVLSYFQDYTVYVDADDFTVTPPLTNNTDEGIIYSIYPTNVASIDASTGLISILSIGDAIITASQASSTNYTASSISATLIVLPLENQLFWAADQSVVYNSEQFSIPIEQIVSSGELSYNSANDEIATIDYFRGIISPVGVGTVVLTLSQASDQTYSESSDSLVLTVTPAAPTISTINLEYTYGDQPFEFNSSIVSSTSQGALSFSSSDDTILSIDGKTASINSAGSVVITVVQEASSNYGSTTASFTVVINKALPVLVVPETITLTYGGSDYSVLMQSPSDGNLSFVYNPVLVASVQSYVLNQTGAELLISPTNAGTTQLTVIQEEGSNYLSATGNIAVIVTKTDPFIVFDDVEVTYGDTPLELNFESTSTAAVSFSSLDESIAKIDGNELSIEGNGEVQITLIQEANANYNSAIATMTLRVSKKQLTVSGIKAKDKIYDGTTTAELDMTSIVFDGLVNGDELFIDANADFESANVGTDWDVTLSSSYSGSDFLKYSITDQLNTNASITPRSVEIRGASDVFKDYDGTTQLIDSDGYVIVGEFITGDEVVVIGKPLFDSTNAGTRVIVQGTLNLSGAMASNYKVNWINGAGIINQTPLKITVLDDSKFVSQDDPIAYNGVTYEGFVSGESVDELSGNLSIVRLNNEVNSPGKYPLVLLASGLSSTNYEITYINGDFDIIPADALLIDIENQSIVYSSIPTYTLNGSYYSSTLSDVIELGAAVFDESTGGYTLDDHIGGYVYFELSLSSNQTVILSSSRNIKVGSYAIEVQNEVINSSSFGGDIVVTGSLSVLPKTLNPYLVQPTKNYDGNRAFVDEVLTLEGLLENDIVQINFEGLYQTANAGIDLPYDVSSIQLSGVDKDNYQLSKVEFNGTDGTINPVTLSISAENVIKIYEGAVNESYPLNFNGFIEGEDSFELGGSLVIDEPAFSASNVGVFPITISGFESTNYQISYQGALLEITPADLYIHGIGVEDKVYDGGVSTTVDYSEILFEGLVDGDEILVDAVGTFETPTVGEDKTVNYTYSISGTDKNNYSISTEFSSTASIIKASLRVIPNDITVNYSGIIFEDFTLSFEGFTSGENSSVLSGAVEYFGTALEAISGGSYLIEVRGLDSENYDIAFETGTLTIVEGDIDTDGIVDSLDPDIDGDQILNEGDSDVNGDGIIDNGPDFDTDGMNDDFDPDDDNDFLTDLEEQAYGTDPFNSDSDFDGVIDGTELVDNTDPLAACDFIWENRTLLSYQDEWLALDCDGDGLINAVEVDLDTDQDGVLDFLDDDDDGDTLLTKDEGADPNNNGLNDDSFDFDNNGIPDYLEKNKLDPNVIVARVIEIYNAISPNGDGDNDYFIIRNIEKYPDNDLFVMNKDGDLIAKIESYGKDGNYFYGLNKDSEALVQGIYYYVLRIRQHNLVRTIKGFLYINW